MPAEELPDDVGRIEGPAPRPSVIAPAHRHQHDRRSTTTLPPVAQGASAADRVAPRLENRALIGARPKARRLWGWNRATAAGREGDRVVRHDVVRVAVQD